ncbi:MAG: type II secretion system F family protein [Candidatus Omnitrophota bacterium]
MALYYYRAKKGPKEIVEGELAAENKDAAVVKLSSQGLIPVHLEEKVSGYEPKITAVKSGKVTLKEVNIFARQLASLLKSGNTLLRSLDILSRQAHNAYFQWAVGQMARQVKEGSTFSQALSGFGRIFPALYVNMVRSGEEAGTLDEVLRRLAEYGEKTEEMRSKIKAALAYPSLLIILGMGTVFVLLTFFMPRLVNLFQDLGQTLPLPTRILIALSSFLQVYWPWLIVVVAGIVVFARKRGLRAQERVTIDWLKLKIPVMADLIRKENISSFTRSLSLLLKGGLPIFRAIEIITPTLTNTKYRQMFEKAGNRIVQGVSLAKSMEEQGGFEPFEINMVAVGEESGRLDESLLEIAKSYEADMEGTLRVATSLLEPLIIIGVGCIVGFIVFAMLLPIFQMDITAM